MISNETFKFKLQIDTNTESCKFTRKKRLSSLILRCCLCDRRCLPCSGSQSTQCNSCDKTSKYAYFQYHACVSSCSPGFYLLNSSFKCSPCHETCLNCTSSLQ